MTVLQAIALILSLSNPHDVCSVTEPDDITFQLTCTDSHEYDGSKEECDLYTTAVGQTMVCVGPVVDAR